MRFSENQAEVDTRAVGGFDVSTSDSDLTLFSVAALYIKAWRKLLASFILCGLAAAGVVLLRGSWYTATAQFVPETGSDADLSALAGLAGQVGISLGNRSGPPPDLYADLATSPVILTPIASDSFSITRGGTRVALSSLLKAKGATRTREIEKAADKLRKLTAASYSRRNGMIALTVRTRWPNVSVEIANQILSRLNQFNLQTRQTRGKAERIFAEKQANEARVRLRDAEEAQRSFLSSNRSINDSPALTLEAQRLAREVGLRQQLMTSLEESLARAQLREIQDTPVITILESPRVLSVPDSRGLLKYSILGAFAGLLVASALVPVLAMMRQAQAERQPDAEQFYSALTGVRADLRAAVTLGKTKRADHAADVGS